MSLQQKSKIALALALVLGCGTTALSNNVHAEVLGDEDHSFLLEGITVEAQRPDWETKLSPGTVTVVRPDDYKGEQKSLPDLLRKVPGVHVREVNGKGQYTTVTVRGSTAAQVGVFIDGVLSNLGGDAAVDISTIPIKNVERVEVYRGYIPSRFPGTFMGGVINIVTKKPEKTNVSAEVGPASYGGLDASLQITAPAGSGSLMVGINHEASDGDFKYKNFMSKVKANSLKKEINIIQNINDNFHKYVIDDLINDQKISLTPEEKEHFYNDEESWLDFVYSEDEYGLAQEVKKGYPEEVAGMSVVEFKSIMEKQGYKDAYIATGVFDEHNWLEGAAMDWDNPVMGFDIIDAAAKQEIIDEYVDENIDGYVEGIRHKADPSKNSEFKDNEQHIKDDKKKLKEAENPDRWRKYNDYKKSSSIVKWQNDKWVIKGSWNKMDRHLPDNLWGSDDASVADNFYNVDLYDTYRFDSRHQDIETTDLLVQNRNEVGKLEWGWMVDYTHQDKDYKAEHLLDISEAESNWTPLSEWSKYKSNKYNGQIDGSYRLSDNNMLDFQMNYAYEKMDIDGSKMDKVLEGIYEKMLVGQMRNRYEQEVFNVQLQDSITLDKNESWILTPSIRYNQSKITGISDGKRFKEGQFKWITPHDSETNGKATWQLAMKKEFNENFTLRMTGGTYYRLLNMYEIAGDGAGILPAVRKEGLGSIFPKPESGKQFDVSAIWNGRALGADNKSTITYFWRDSENMLQLVRAGLYHWSYFNDNKGTAKGVELESEFNWNKFGLDLQATYTHADMQRKNSAVNYDYSDVWATYQPKWEGHIRLNYSPTQDMTFFTEAHFVDEYFTCDARDTTSAQKDYLAGKPVSSIWVVNGGMKLKFKDKWQVALGCNDIFNEGPKQKITSTSLFNGIAYVNPEFPIQGRTYYATLRYDF